MRTVPLLAILALAACRAVEAPAAASAPRTGPLIAEDRAVEPSSTPARAAAPEMPAAGGVPAYPELSRRLQEEGTVELEIEILQNGAVRSVEVARSSGHRRLDDAALAAARTWRFNPRTGGPDVQVILHRVVFRLVNG